MSNIKLILMLLIYSNYFRLIINYYSYFILLVINEMLGPGYNSKFKILFAYHIYFSFIEISLKKINANSRFELILINEILVLVEILRKI